MGLRVPDHWSGESTAVPTRVPRRRGLLSGALAFSLAIGILAPNVAYEEMNSPGSLAVVQGTRKEGLPARVPAAAPSISALFEAPPSEYTSINPVVEGGCDPGVRLTAAERAALLDRLRISTAGTKILESFRTQYTSLSNLVIHWSSSSYSQVGGPFKDRAPASGKSSSLGAGVCVYLARRLPQIEHVADLAHELVHATRLEASVLRGELSTAEEFVRARLEGKGGEAEAFCTECQVKFELLGYWDSLCSPYVKGQEMSRARVLEDLYNGELSASLTGETYPVMLERQFRAVSIRRAVRSQYSALENPKDLQ